jgi:hypothetical protein
MTRQLHARIALWSGSMPVPAKQFEPPNTAQMKKAPAQTDTTIACRSLEFLMKISVEKGAEFLVFFDTREFRFQRAKRYAL